MIVSPYLWNMPDSPGCLGRGMLGSDLVLLQGAVDDLVVVASAEMEYLWVKMMPKMVREIHINNSHV